MFKGTFPLSHSVRECRHISTSTCILSRALPQPPSSCVFFFPFRGYLRGGGRRSASGQAIAAISASSVAPSRGRDGKLTVVTPSGRRLIRSTKGEFGTPSEFRVPSGMGREWRSERKGCGMEAGAWSGLESARARLHHLGSADQVSGSTAMSEAWRVKVRCVVLQGIAGIDFSTLGWKPA